MSERSICSPDADIFNLPFFSAVSSQTNWAQLVWLDTALKNGKLNISASGEQIDLSDMQLPRDSVALACLAFRCLGYTVTQAIEKSLSRVTLPGRLSRYRALYRDRRPGKVTRDNDFSIA